MSKLNVIILGANSHIAKGLIYNFLEDNCAKLYLYTTHKNTTINFIDTLKKNDLKNIVVCGYNDKFISKVDLIINCVGVGTPKQLNENYSAWFDVLEKFDNLCIDYIKKNKKTLYIHFSSGAVYGNNFLAPVNKNTRNNLFVNKLDINNFYSISKLYAEAKHRSYTNLNIVDLRIFSYFSRFANLQDGYFLSDIVNSVINKKTLIVDEQNIIRDYISPKDLFNIVIRLSKIDKINDSFDLISKKIVDKKTIIKFFVKNYGLKYKIKNNLKFINSSGSKNIYCSKYNKLTKIINYNIKYKSIETIDLETKILLKQNA